MLIEISSYFDDPNTSSTRLVKVQGFETAGLVDGQKWEDTEIAVIGTSTHGAKTVLLAVPLKQVQAGLSSEQFATLLKQTGIRMKLEQELEESKTKAEAAAKARLAEV
jgi:hypothetical protein